ncbi:uncharacterized protein SCHCODRAFT_02010591 [Schizophyllum commune H4-8]|uniref:uncharacterized protein n=1 Tax=Schizophyllum commune (strain H4-8 / FGSC 9210) TaxID=578458 RepID=UPI00215EE568|nr:uncharacterized protein SCHCODRAFT_02010591 [Schizophyllum commune H4-8]KAI5899397.1 hypothetical protein SCHCODRAFT_02010591 [Schizophyllum commune H4-8]
MRTGMALFIVLVEARGTIPQPLQLGRATLSRLSDRFLFSCDSEGPFFDKIRRIVSGDPPCHARGRSRAPGPQGVRLRRWDIGRPLSGRSPENGPGPAPSPRENGAGGPARSQLEGFPAPPYKPKSTMPYDSHLSPAADDQLNSRPPTH